jgi:hypothetical protein
VRASILFVFGGLSVSLVWAGGVSRGDENTIRLTQTRAPKDQIVEVTVGGKPFTVYHFSRANPRPFFGPMFDRQGDIITRAIAPPADPPRPNDRHDLGLSFAVDRVNGIDYWSERGWIMYFSLNTPDSSQGPAHMKVYNAWLDQRKERVLTESTTVGIYPNRLITYDATLTAEKKPVTFEDTKDGLFGLRLVDSMSEAAGGTVVSSDGHHGTSECWGQSFDWVDYSGSVKGKTVGVALFDNPHNFRRSRYQVCHDGLFSISPFGEHAYTNGKNPAVAVHLAPGANLRLKYGIYVHDGDTKTANVANVFRVYLAESRD